MVRSLLNKAVALCLFLAFGICFSTKPFELKAISQISPDSIISITNSDLSLFTGPRDYYTLVVLTSTDAKHECEVCLELVDIVRIVAQSWNADYSHSTLLYFVNIDIVDRTNIEIFERLGINSIPNVSLVPPNDTIAADSEDQYALLTNPHFPFKVPVASQQDQIMELARFLSELLQKDILIRTEDPTIKFFKTFTATLFFIILLKKKGPNILRRSGKRKWTALFFIMLTLVFVSGYQFTTSAAVPFIARNDKGEIIYISGGIYYQFGIEIVLVAVNYFLLAMTFVFMIYIGTYKVTATSKIKQDSVKTTLALVSNLVLFLLFSCLTSMFLRKDHEYPYGLAKLF